MPCNCNRRKRIPPKKVVDGKTFDVLLRPTTSKPTVDDSRTTRAPLEQTLSSTPRQKPQTETDEKILRRRRVGKVIGSVFYGRLNYQRQST